MKRIPDPTHTGERALELWDAALTAIKRGRLDEAEKIASSMWIKSDAIKVRGRIAAARVTA